MTPGALTIAGFGIRTDEAGRFCLNDLHRASGGESKRQPAFWLRSAQARALADEIENSADLHGLSAVFTREGAAGGTYVAKELVYAYAMWISPVFHLKVIRAYDAMQTPAAPLVPTTMAQALRLAAEQAEQLEQQQAALALAAPKVDFVDRYVACPAGTKGFREVCKLLKANEREFMRWLVDEQILYRLAGKMVPHAQHLDAGRFVVRTGQALTNDHPFEQTNFTPKGFVWVAGQWTKHKASQVQEGRAA